MPWIAFILEDKNVMSLCSRVMLFVVNFFLALVVFVVFFVVRSSTLLSHEPCFFFFFGRKKCASLNLMLMSAEWFSLNHKNRRLIIVDFIWHLRENMKEFFFYSLFFFHSMIWCSSFCRHHKYTICLLEYLYLSLCVFFFRCASFKFNLKESFVTNCTILYSHNKE